MACRAIILGCSGYSFSPDEIQLFEQAEPWGLILFKRNISDLDQVRELCQRFRDLVGRADAPVFVDQEGGRVQRLSAPYWPKYPAAEKFLAVYSGDLAPACDLAYLSARLTAHDLQQVGISVNCMPVLDVPIPGAHQAIGDRAYSPDPRQIAELGLAAARGLLSGGILPVVKHMPGQGRAMLDSHEALPRVDATMEELSKSDFIPFRSLAGLPIGMTGHVLFSQIDEVWPATMSRTVIEKVIRTEIGFQGLLLSDDVSMKALNGGFRERTERLFAAGCDIALHCNGLLDEARAVVEGAPFLSGLSLHRAERALGMRGDIQDDFDPVEGRRKLEAALAHPR